MNNHAIAANASIARSMIEWNAITEIAVTTTATGRWALILDRTSPALEADLADYDLAVAPFGPAFAVTI